MNDHPAIAWAWLALATMTGAVSSIALRPYKEMGRWEIVLAVVVAATFSMFVGSVVAEFVAHWLYGDGPVNLRVFGATLWFMAAASHYLIPVGISRARRAIKAIGGTEQDQ